MTASFPKSRRNPYPCGRKSTHSSGNSNHFSISGIVRIVRPLRNELTRTRSVSTLFDMDANLELQNFSKSKESALVKELHSTAPAAFAQHPVLFAYLYGSYATGCTHPYSDLDIAVYLEPQFTENALDIELDISLELDKALDHKIETEVRAINNLPLTFAGRIITEGLLLYCRDESARVEFEVQIRKKYFDFLPVIEQYHQEYLNKVRQ